MILGSNNAFLTFPEYELYGTYDVDLMQTDVMVRKRLLWINLLLPKIISNSEETDFTNYGRDRINTFIRSSLRPYERRFAKRVGLYDLRLKL